MLLDQPPRRPGMPPTASADDETAFAVQELLAARCAVAPTERTTREPDEPGVRVRFFLDLQQDADTWARGRHLAVLVPGHDGASAAGRRGRPCRSAARAVAGRRWRGGGHRPRG
ncbi:DUF6207 family protein [Streptomyces sp. NPDC056159]|uniref:DUF6207 family protein n=1 Tax=Streptomyces sp. NPDC056159 TaxID=3155537 RepID=UPI00342378D6